MSDARKLLILRLLLAMGVLLAAFWSSANTGWMNPILNLPGVAFVVGVAKVIWMPVALFVGGALTDRKNFIYFLGIAALIPAVLFLMTQPFI